MKTHKHRFILFFLWFGTIPFFSSWGTFGHEHINKAAVFALPAPLQLFFYNHIDFITQESTVPDLRKYTMKDKTEVPRHFIDLEKFGAIDSIPRTFTKAKAMYPDSFLTQYGILPWYLQDMMEKLTTAFKTRRKTEILFLAADLAHYIGDAHMPLHTSLNHDGQFTDQKGIHALWESRLPEMFGKDYNYFTSEARYVEDIQQESWGLILRSHQLVDTLLRTDKKLRKQFAGKPIFKTDASGEIAKNKFNQRVFSDEYALQFHKALNDMVQKQLRAAIVCVSSYWYTAWVNAGKPLLDDLDPAYINQQNAKTLKKEMELWKLGKLTGIESEKEF